MSAGATRVARDYDVVVVGGGLAGQLCVLALAEHAPRVSVALVERAPVLGGNHTWCCHHSDLRHPTVDDSALAAWFALLPDRRWRGYRVRFPRYERVLDGEYLCLGSSSLAAATERALARTGGVLRHGREVSAVGEHTVELGGDETLTARLVLDARGSSAADYAGRAGYQKFVGWEIELPAAQPGHDGLPVLMDATVEQLDGYRFVYSLPFSPNRLLVEDTYFSRRPDFDRATARTRLHAHLRSLGVTSFQRLREETGVLPMPWAEPAQRRGPALTVGYRGGFFHPGTGYSLPRAAIVAERVARAVAAGAGAPAPRVAAALDELRASWRVDDRFARLLNRMAFRLVPGRFLRDAIFARVYRLPAPVLARFYAGRTTRRDRLALAAAPLRIPMVRPASANVPLLGEIP